MKKCLSLSLFVLNKYCNAEFSLLKLAFTYCSVANKPNLFTKNVLSNIRTAS